MNGQELDFSGTRGDTVDDEFKTPIAAEVYQIDQPITEFQLKASSENRKNSDNDFSAQAEEIYKKR